MAKEKFTEQEPLGLETTKDINPGNDPVPIADPALVEAERIKLAEFEAKELAEKALIEEKEQEALRQIELSKPIEVPVETPAEIEAKADEAIEDSLPINKVSDIKPTGPETVTEITDPIIALLLLSKKYGKERPELLLRKFDSQDQDYTYLLREDEDCFVIEKEPLQQSAVGNLFNQWNQKLGELLRDQRQATINKSVQRFQQLDIEIAACRKDIENLEKNRVVKQTFIVPKDFTVNC